MAKKTTLKVPKRKFDTTQDLSIYDYDGKIDNYNWAISLHPNISETTRELITSYHNTMISEGLRIDEKLHEIIQYYTIIERNRKRFTQSTLFEIMKSTN